MDPMGNGKFHAFRSRCHSFPLTCLKLSLIIMEHHLDRQQMAQQIWIFKKVVIHTVDDSEIPNNHLGKIFIYIYIQYIYIYTVYIYIQYIYNLGKMGKITTNLYWLAGFLNHQQYEHL